MARAVFPVLLVLVGAALFSLIERRSHEIQAFAAFPEGRIGSEFAEVYASFAPILAVHESYAAHLFEGTPVAIPPGLESACETFSIELASFHGSLVSREQVTANGLSETLVRLRIEADAFCASFGGTLREIARSGSDPAILDQASEAKLFSEIYALSERMEEAFTEVFDSIDGDESRWVFSVAFSSRALLTRSSIDRVGDDLSDIFYGSDDATQPPFPVPNEVAEAMAELIDLSGRDLVRVESERARALAAVIWRHFASDSEASD